MKREKDLFDEAVGFYEKGMLELAIEKFLSISDKDKSLYAFTLVNLGNIYYELGELDEAIYVYNKVSENIPKKYAESQLNLGGIYYQKGLIDKALEAFNKVPYDEYDLYAKSRVNLIHIFMNDNKLNEAEEAFEEVPKDNLALYSNAQFSLACLYLKVEEYDRAIELFSTISKDVSYYTIAQYNLGLIYNRLCRIDDSIAAFQKIPVSEEEVYAMSQANLMMIFYYTKGVSDAKKIFMNISKDFLDIYRDCQLFLDVSLSSNREFLNKLSSNVKSVLELLRIKSDSLNQSELNIAHYTRPSIAFKMLRKDEGDKKSYFRLSSILGVNDPTEGNVFFKWLGVEPQINENLSIFISCFTFNHDSLNQFRLYGKENNEEASGVSLVFNGKCFFEQYSDRLLGVNSPLYSNADNYKVEKKGKKMSKLPLYRCIYIDSESEYVTLAAREEITFYREKAPKLNFKDYNTEIEKIKIKVIDLLNNIRVDVNNNYNKLGEKDREIFMEIILPLRYLIKHSAFKEEQEARMLYISSLFNSQIKTDENNTQMYLEYPLSVKGAIHRIYLSPGAEKYKDYFRRCLNDVDRNKVKVSSNPFRNKKY